MNLDELKHLLHKADLPAQTVAPAELAARVRLGYARAQQTRRRAALAASLLVAALGFGGWLLVQRDADSETIVAQTASDALDAELRAELEELDAQVEFHRALARRLIDQERGEQSLAAARRAAALEIDEDVQLQLDIVAYRMIYSAEALVAAMRPDQESIEIYERVVQLFPTTDAAGVARERLADLGQPSGGI